jgi:hypothetical protein
MCLNIIHRLQIWRKQTDRPTLPNVVFNAIVSQFAVIIYTVFSSCIILITELYAKKFSFHGEKRAFFSLFYIVSLLALVTGIFITADEGAVVRAVCTYRRLWPPDISHNLQLLRACSRRQMSLVIGWRVQNFTASKPQASCSGNLYVIHAFLPVYVIRRWLCYWHNLDYHSSKRRNLPNVPRLNTDALLCKIEFLITFGLSIVRHRPVVVELFVR